MAAGATMELGGDTLAALIGLVREHTGIAMSERKGTLLQGRLLARIRALGLTGYAAYIERVRRGGDEVVAFISLVTTNDTAFFRTPAVWSYLRGDFLPAWHAESPGRTLRLWSAAAATGEEAYSLAMACADFQLTHPTFRFTIDATDISADALAVAAAGRYDGRSAQRFEAAQPDVFARHMVRDGDGWAVRPTLRRHVRFGRHHLLRDARAQEFDMVLLRNVLMYFADEDQRRALHGVHAALAPQGRLVVGEQDAIERLGAPFRFERPHVWAKEAA